MGCFFALLALITPRVVIVLLWLFTHWFRGTMWVVLLLGFIFLPTTLLWYTAVQHWFGGQWTFWPVAGMVIALAIDLSPAKHGRRRS